MAEIQTLSLNGGCQCGQIRYHIHGQPADSVTVCHCRMCQKAMGNVFGIFAGFQFRDLSWTKGTPSKFQSSSTAYRLFCSNCGTPLAFEPVDPTNIYITIGSLDNPNELPAGKQIGTESRIIWINSLPNLPAKTTEENQDKPIDIVNYQHPDHD